MSHIFRMIVDILLLSSCSHNPQYLPGSVTPFDVYGIVGGGDADSFAASSSYVASVLTSTAEVQEDIKAKRFLVTVLGDTGPLLARAADQSWPTASIAKLMSAVIVAEHLDCSHLVAMTTKAIATEGESGQFVPQEQFLVYDLLRAMLIASSNDAAEALALYANRETFVRRMNEKARELGMDHTTFVDPSGLSDKNRSTPEDLLTLIAFIYAKHADLLAITRLSSVRICDVQFGHRKQLLSTNEFTRTVSTASDVRRVEFIGGKTGYTASAIGNLVSLFSVHGYTIAIVVMGSTDRFGDTRRLLARAAPRFR